MYFIFPFLFYFKSCNFGVLQADQIGGADSLTSGAPTTTRSKPSETNRTMATKMKVLAAAIILCICFGELWSKFYYRVVDFIDKISRWPETTFVFFINITYFIHFIAPIGGQFCVNFLRVIRLRNFGNPVIELFKFDHKYNGA